MKLYLDVLVLQNFIVNLALIMITFKVLKYKYSFKKAILVGFLGGLYSLTMVIDELKPFKEIYFQIVVAFLMIYVPLKIKNKVILIKSFFTFIGISFFLSGICFKFIIASQEYSIVNGTVIKEFDVKYLILAIFIVFIILERITIYIKDKSVLSTFIYDVSMKVQLKEIEIKVFLDSGNELREPITNLPCLLIEEKELKGIILEKDEMYQIPYKSIGHSGGLYGFKVENIVLKKKGEIWRVTDGIVCPCREVLSKENEFTGLISRGVI